MIKLQPFGTFYFCPIQPINSRFSKKYTQHLYMIFQGLPTNIWHNQWIVPNIIKSVPEPNIPTIHQENMVWLFLICNSIIIMIYICFLDRHKTNDTLINVFRTISSASFINNCSNVCSNDDNNVLGRNFFPLIEPWTSFARDIIILIVPYKLVIHK